MIETIHRVSIGLPVPGEDVGQGPTIDAYLDVTMITDIADRMGATSIESVQCPACAMCSCETSDIHTARAIKKAWKTQLRLQGLPETYLTD